MKTRNVLYIKSIDQMWLDIIKVLDEQYSWKPAMWIGSKSTQNIVMTELYPKASYYPHNDAFCGLEPQTIIELDRSKTLDKDFLSYLSKYESIFYEMMNRWCVAPDHVAYEDRRMFFLTMARVWIRIIHTFKIDVIICPTIPHRLYDYVAYLVAKRLDVPFLFIEDVCEVRVLKFGARESWSFVADDIENRSWRLQQVFKDNPDASPTNMGQRYLKMARHSYDKAVPTYFKKKQDKKAQKPPVWRQIYDLVPFEVKGVMHLVKDVTMGKNLKTGKLHFSTDDQRDGDMPVLGNRLQAHRRHAKTKKIVERAIDWYENAVEEPDLSCPFIYLAPHFQPERTTTPDTGLYQHVEIIVETLVAALPEGWKIYYKEHPSNFRKPIRLDNVRNVAYYQSLQKLTPQIRFLDIATDPFLLIDNAKAVATGRGTSGWQAVTRGKPALIFGDAWYTGCPGVFRIHSIDDMRNFFKELEDLEINPAQTAAYLAAVERCSWNLNFRRQQGFETFKETDANYYRQCIADHAEAYVTGFQTFEKYTPSK